MSSGATLNFDPNDKKWTTDQFFKESGTSASRRGHAFVLFAPVQESKTIEAIMAVEQSGKDLIVRDRGTTPKEKLSELEPASIKDRDIFSFFKETVKTRPAWSGDRDLYSKPGQGGFLALWSIDQDGFGSLGRISCIHAEPESSDGGPPVGLRFKFIFPGAVREFKKEYGDKAKWGVEIRDMEQLSWEDIVAAVPPPTKVV